MKQQKSEIPISFSICSSQTHENPSNFKPLMWCFSGQAKDTHYGNYYACLIMNCKIIVLHLIFSFQYLFSYEYISMILYRVAFYLHDLLVQSYVLLSFLKRFRERSVLRETKCHLKAFSTYSYTYTHFDNFAYGILCIFAKQLLSRTQNV